MQREQFQSNLDSGLRVWLIDQKPKNLSEAARLADQYVAVRKADRPMYKGHSSPHKGHVSKPKPFGASGHSNSSGGFQKSTSAGYYAKPHTEQKPSTTSSGPKGHYFNPRTGDVCYYCKRPGHIMANCNLRAKHREREQKEASVQLVSTLSSQVTEGQVSTTEVQKSPEVDPRFEGHCSLVTMVRPDLTRHIVRALRNTGALQSLVSQQSISDCDFAVSYTHLTLPTIYSV